MPLAMRSGATANSCNNQADSPTPSLINTVPSEAPGPHDYRSISIGGEVGEPVVYDILYRSRREYLSSPARFMLNSF